MPSYRKSRKKDWLKTLIYITVYLVVLGFAGIYLLLSYWYVWIALTAGGLIILVFWHAKATVYHCPRCGYDCEISVFTDFFSPHGVDRKGAWKYLKCPNCSNRSRMEILVKIDRAKSKTKTSARVCEARYDFSFCARPTIF